MINKKTKKILAGSLSAVAAVGAGVAITVPLTANAQQTTHHIESVEVGQVNQQIPGSQTQNKPIGTPVIPGSTTSGSSTTVTNTQTFGMTLTKNVSRTASKTYTMNITNNEQTEGTIYIVKGGTELVQSIEFNPGEEIVFFFDPNRGYENYTVRDFKITGKSQSHFVPTLNHPDDKRAFIAQMPTVEETIDKMTGESWLYGDGAITVNPSFIISDIGQNGQTVEWTHGAFFESINGYVFSMDRDMTWSEIEQKYEAFKNEDKDNLINLYFFLNGHTLTMDKNIEQEDMNRLAPKGWNLLFYNNNMDAKDPRNGFGKIEVQRSGDEMSAGVFRFDGSITLGRSIHHRTIAYRDEGLIFLNPEDRPGLIGDQVSDPSGTWMNK